MKTYNIWITFYGPSAKNCGIVGANQKKRSSWATGKLEYVPINDGTQVNFQFTARDDERAWYELCRLYKEKYPSERRPISGKSYLRSCR